MAASLLRSVRNTRMSESHTQFREGICTRGSLKIVLTERNTVHSGVKDSSINFSVVRNKLLRHEEEMFSQLKMCRFSNVKRSLLTVRIGWNVLYNQ